LQIITKTCWSVVFVSRNVCLFPSYRMFKSSRIKLYTQGLKYKMRKLFSSRLLPVPGMQQEELFADDDVTLHSTINK